MISAPTSALIYCSQTSHIHTAASSYRQVFFVLEGPDVEFSGDQVSPKKEIPTELKPKCSAAGWGLQGLDTVKEMLMWSRARAQTRQLVLDLVDIPLSQGSRARMVHHHRRRPTSPRLILTHDL